MNTLFPRYAKILICFFHSTKLMWGWFLPEFCQLHVFKASSIVQSHALIGSDRIKLIQKFDYVITYGEHERI